MRGTFVDDFQSDDVKQVRRKCVVEMLVDPLGETLQMGKQTTLHHLAVPTFWGATSKQDSHISTEEVHQWIIAC